MKHEGWQEVPDMGLLEVGLKLKLLQLPEREAALALGQGRLLSLALLEDFPRNANDRGSPFITSAGTLF